MKGVNFNVSFQTDNRDLFETDEILKSIDDRILIARNRLKSFRDVTNMIRKSFRSVKVDIKKELDLKNITIKVNKVEGIARLKKDIRDISKLIDSLNTKQIRFTGINKGLIRLKNNFNVVNDTADTFRKKINDLKSVKLDIKFNTGGISPEFIQSLLEVNDQLEKMTELSIAAVKNLSKISGIKAPNFRNSVTKLSLLDKLIKSIKRSGSRAFNAMNSSINKFVISITKSVTGINMITRSVKMLDTVSRAYLSYMVIDFIGNLRRQATEIPAMFERYKTIFTTLSGSTKNAEKDINRLIGLLKEIPTTYSEIANTEMRVKAFGLPDTNDFMKSMYDLSAAMNKTSIQAVEMIGDAIVGEFERLKEFGIKAMTIGTKVKFQFVNNLGKQMVVTVDNTKEKISEVISLISKAKFSGVAIKQMQTFEGIIKSIKGKWELIVNKVMTTSSVFQKLKNVLVFVNEKMSEFLDNDNPKSKEMIEKINKGLVDGVRFAAKFASVVYAVGKTIATFTIPIIKSLYSTIMDIFSSILLGIAKFQLELQEIKDITVFGLLEDSDKVKAARENVKLEEKRRDLLIEISKINEKIDNEVMNNGSKTDTYKELISQRDKLDKEYSKQFGDSKFMSTSLKAAKNISIEQEKAFNSIMAVLNTEISATDEFKGKIEAAEQDKKDAYAKLEKIGAKEGNLNTEIKMVKEAKSAFIKLQREVKVLEKTHADSNELAKKLREMYKYEYIMKSNEFKSAVSQQDYIKEKLTDYLSAMKSSITDTKKYIAKLTGDTKTYNRLMIDEMIADLKRKGATEEEIQKAVELKKQELREKEIKNVRKHTKSIEDIRKEAYQKQLDELNLKIKVADLTGDNILKSELELQKELVDAKMSGITKYIKYDRLRAIYAQKTNTKILIAALKAKKEFYDIIGNKEKSIDIDTQIKISEISEDNRYSDVEKEQMINAVKKKNLSEIENIKADMYKKDIDMQLKIEKLKLSVFKNFYDTRASKERILNLELQKLEADRMKKAISDEEYILMKKKLEIDYEKSITAEKKRQQEYIINKFGSKDDKRSLSQEKEINEAESMLKTVDPESNEYSIIKKRIEDLKEERRVLDENITAYNTFGDNVIAIYEKVSLYSKKAFKDMYDDAFAVNEKIKNIVGEFATQGFDLLSVLMMDTTAKIFGATDKAKKSFKDAFRDMAVAALRSIAQMISKLLVMMALVTALNAIPGGSAVLSAMDIGSKVTGVSDTSSTISSMATAFGDTTQKMTSEEVVKYVTPSQNETNETVVKPVINVNNYTSSKVNVTESNGAVNIDIVEIDRKLASLAVANKSKLKNALS